MPYEKPGCAQSHPSRKFPISNPANFANRVCNRMKALYLDCISGISGDMMVGALIDLGVKPSALEWELSKLNVGEFHMHYDRAKRKEIEGVKFDIHEGGTHHEHGHECGGGHEHGEEHGHVHHHHEHDDDPEHHHHEDP